MSEISGEEVDYGSFGSIANPSTDSDHARAKISSQYTKECKPRMSKSRVQFAVH